ncbi:hypothetical protein KC332_g11634 [Hortaea werneckii]|nr:hypothetical protein KC358_g6894 [Hortaea werneckii]KAI6835769.1 hypothetical protein KC350_g6438 [Hortaea werneckii]KAI6931193.1 hypothetical protein KC348_g7349 [Hortaea werneckii]KAI6935721.1 hypothetical protein KC341_g6714 [Hortaea werneckii]KAI6970585.1 hypothetical protein KC321_g7236 [Hortaea werneckii]
MSSSNTTSYEEYTYNLFAYEPNHVLPIVFACIVGASVVAHVIQNFYYSFWRITFFMFYGGTVFTVGWILRAAASYNQENLGLYISQIVFILAGPPIYAAAEYNILGRLMHYLPMHAVFHPGRAFGVFVFVGIVVETFTGVGAGQLAGGVPGSTQYTVGGILIGITLILQGCVEITFSSLVARVCIMLYCTSALILIRCIFRAIENFTEYLSDCGPGVYHCGYFATHEWYLYVFECVPMVIYSYWLNIQHPGRFLPLEHKRYLDLDGVTERMGPGWIDKRSKWQTFLDSFNCGGRMSEEARFWERPEEWPVCDDGSFALKTATNRGKKASLASMREKKNTPTPAKRKDEKASSSLDKV